MIPIVIADPIHPPLAATQPPALPLLVTTRFQLPVATSSVVPRPTVSAHLDAFADRPLVILAAPTGYGKTTVLASWLRERHAPYAWLSLEPGDDQPVRFATYLISAVRRALPAVGTAALTALQNPANDLGDVIGSLVNDVAAQDAKVVLVLDDYHVIRDPGCRAIVATLVAALPAQLQLILATRGDPALPVGRLRAQGRLGEIRVDDLRFSSAEAEAFLRERIGGALDAATIAALEERTEGWPAALNLAAMSIATQDDPDAFVREFTGSNLHIVDYLVSEVLDAQSPEMRSFLLKTSVLDRLCGDLCDAVTGTSGGAGRLTRLARTNMFVTGYDDASHWYRYHRMFREALRVQLAEELPGVVPGLLVTAARWHEADGGLVEAIQYAVAADDMDLAGSLVARHYLTFTRGGHLLELRDLIGSLDTARLTSTRGPVAFAAAVAAGLAGDAAAVVERHLEEVTAYGIGDDTLDGVPSTEAAVLFIRAVYPYDDVACQQQAGSQLRARYAGAPLMAAAGQLALGYTAYLADRPDAARAALEPFGLQPDHRLMSVLAISLRALVELDAGRPDVAAVAATQAYRAVEQLGLQDAVATSGAYLALGASRLAEGRLDEARPLLARAASLVQPTQPLQRALTLLVLATAAGRDGAVTEALASASEARTLIESCPDPAALPARLRSVERHLRDIESGTTDRALPTVAELRVLRLLPSLLSQREIAQELYLSPDTVKTHVRRLYRKLGVDSREAAVETARRQRLL